MRYKQSHYRANTLKIPFGTGPNENSNLYYGNMLTKKDGDAGRNFLNDIIFQVVKERVFRRYGALDPFRLLRNMLSSQPMCFNLFGMMKNDLLLATDFWKIHFPEIKEIIRVELEYAPQPAAKYLNDRTAFDSYFEYITVNSKKGLIGIEVKFTEPFSQQHYDSEYYRRWSGSVDSPWIDGTCEQLSNINYNQLWRDHLLVVSMINQPNSEFQEGKLVLIRHPDDSDCERCIEQYKKHLKPDNKTFREFQLSNFLSPFNKIKTDQIVQKWLDDFKLRYIA